MAAFDSRSLTNSELQSFVASNLTNQPLPISRWNLDALTLAAFYYHPILQVARAQSQTAAAGKVTANTRPNPTVGFNPGYNFDAIRPTSPWMPGMTIDIPIETAGKKGKRVLQAQFNEEAARLNIAATAWQVRSNLRNALIEVSAASQREHLVARQITNQNALINSLEQRFAAGAVARSEIAPFQINRVKLQSDLASARSASVQARAHFGEAIGIPARTLESAQIDDAISTNNEPLAPSQTTELRASALQHRADLLALLARYEAAQAGLQLEIAKQYPDVRLGSGYQWDQGESKWNLSLNVEIPIFNRNRGPIAEAEARRAEIAAQLLDAQARVINEIDRSFVAFNSAQEELEGARETLSALAQQSKLTRQRLEAGGADQVEVLTTLIEESAASLVALDAKVRLAIAAAQIEAALQVPLSYLNSTATLPLQP